MHGAQCRHYGRNTVKIRLRLRAVDVSEARAMREPGIDEGREMSDPALERQDGAFEMNNWFPHATPTS